jgi:hypothetical protein
MSGALLRTEHVAKSFEATKERPSDEGRRRLQAPRRGAEGNS